MGRIHSRPRPSPLSLGTPTKAERERLVAQLEVERSRLTALFEKSPAAVAVLQGEELRFSFTNERYRRLFGREGDLVGRTLAEAFPEACEQGFDAILREVVATGLPYAHPELAQALRDAESFSYAISHDLRTPLRAVASTASVLLEELGPELREEHRELLQRQARSVVRMGGLIDDLLGLSRLGRQEIVRQPLDMSRLARKAPSSGAEIEVQEGMAAVGDPRLAALVWAILIDNALKFSPQGGRVRAGFDG